MTNSFFLFGARGTGKSTLLNTLFKTEEALFIDLLDPLEEDLFNRNPNELLFRIQSRSPACRWVVLDEVQRAPKLLDIAHSLIESEGLLFAITGSSSRKLKRGVSNLLAGRAFVNYLHPLTHLELGEAFDLGEALQWGTLPKVFQFVENGARAQFLRSYALTYLKEEIAVEGLVRKLNPFRNFLEIAAQCNGTVLNFTKIANDVGVDTKTVQSYFSILEDTLIGRLLPAFHKSIRKQQRSNPKFYFFDLGVKRALERTLSSKIIEHSREYGYAFEHFIITELFRLNDYALLDWRFSYLRTKDDAEIDLIIDRPGLPLALVEIKSTTRVTQREVSALNRFAKDIPDAEALLISRDPHRKRLGKVLCLPWNEAFNHLGATVR